MNKQKIQNVRKTNVGVVVHDNPKIKSNVGVALLGDPKGITLIALVITIVVLIILAGVAINLTLNNNGIFTKAKEAREKYLNAQEDEEKQINELSKQLESGEYGNSNNPPILQKVEDLKTSGTYMTAKTTVEDSNGNIIVIPSGFKIASDSGANVTEGIVIEDNDVKTGIGNNRGNQYVWIPVGTGIRKSDGTTQDIILGRYIFADGTNHKDTNGNALTIGTPILKQNANSYIAETAINVKEQESTSTEDYSLKELTTYREGKASSGTDGENRTFRGKQLSDGSYEGIKSFIDSVNANGGYYIARYEASYGFYGTDTTAKAKSKVSNSYTDSWTAPTTRTEGMLWNWITQINAAVACENLYTTVNSDLINSYAWDTAIVYIQKFSNDADYSRQDGCSINLSLTNTGVNGDEVCKINDMASNILEWTTEYSTYTDSSNAYPCTDRGGDFYSTSDCTSNRDYNDATASYMVSTFRSTLYM